MVRVLADYKGLKVPVPDASNPGGLAIQNNFTKTVDWSPPSVWDQTTDPGASADVNAGFYPGSRWLNTTTAKVWTCVDNTASAAVWQLGGSPAQTFVVNSQAAMLALDAHQGDLAVRTDLNETFILTTDDPTVLANWQELSSPGAVVSVNGYTGVVVLTKSDIGLSNVTNSLQLIAADNLSDLTNAGTARTNLGLGTIATQDASSVAITGGTINGAAVTGLPAPSAGTDAATKTYVDATAQGLQVKPTAAAATTAALPANAYSNGSSGVGATLTASSNGALTVDGYSVAVSDVVLVKNESTASHNGLYTVTQAGDGSHPYILTRHVDMDQAAEFPGAFVPVGNAGTANANSLWLANPSTPVTVGTTAIPFTQLNGATDLTAGTGLAISGNTISIDSGWLSGGAFIVAHGGTGATSLTAHGILLGEGMSAIAATAAMTDGQLLIGQSSADPLPKTLSGDATLGSTGAIALANSGSTRTNLGVTGGADIFGDGSDGSVTISSNTSLTRDMNYSSLTVNDGIKLLTKGFIIRCTGKVDTKTSGIIDCSGGDGGNGNNGTSSGQATGGSVGTSALSSSFTNVYAMGIGGQGAAGASAASAANGPGSTASFAGSGLIFGGLVSGTPPSGGNAAAGANTGGTPSANIYSLAVQQPMPSIFANVYPVFVSGAFAPGTIFGIPGNYGAGGASTTGAGGGAGGGSGAGGGYVSIAANEIAGAGTISAVGGKGGNGGNAYASTGNAGGGAAGCGGGGGLLRLFYNALSFSGTLSVSGGNGGTGGSGHGTGTNGGNGLTGATGNLYKYNLTTRVWE